MLYQIKRDKIFFGFLIDDAQRRRESEIPLERGKPTGFVNVTDDFNFLSFVSG